MDFFDESISGLEQDKGTILLNNLDKERNNKNGWTILFWACADGDLVKVKELINSELNLAHKDKSGRTIFDVASGARKDKVVQYLRITFPHIFGNIDYIKSYRAILIENTISLISENGTSIFLENLLFGEKP